MKNRQLLVYIIFAGLLFSCSKNDDNVNPKDQNNPLSSAMINREYMKATISGDTSLNWYYENTSNMSEDVYFYQELQLLVSLRSGQFQTQKMSINLSPYFGSGTYEFSDEHWFILLFNNQNSTRYSTSMNSSNNPSIRGSGTIVVREVSNGIRAEFDCIAFSKNGDSIHIEEGELAIKYPWTYPACNQDEYSGPILNSYLEDYCRMAYYADCHGNTNFTKSVSCETYRLGQQADSLIPDCPYCQ